jgi:integrase/recombinase XerD
VKLYSCLELYIKLKRNAGYEYSGVAKVLSQFARTVGNVQMRNVTESQVTRFFEATKISNSTWRGRYGLLRGFFNYCLARRLIGYVPLPPKVPLKRSSFSPYIYSRYEIAALLNATVQCQAFRICSLEPETLKRLLLFLYGTGMLVSEALQLNVGDIDLPRGVMRIQSASATRARSLPVGRDLRTLLTEQLDLRARKSPGQDKYLFVNEKGARISSTTLIKTFQRLRRLANVGRYDAAVYQPRVHDLRHTFAVHSIDSWYRQGLAVDQMLPRLTLYMGNTRLTNMEKYLKLTQVKFEPELRKLSAVPRT